MDWQFGDFDGGRVDLVDNTSNFVFVLVYQFDGPLLCIVQYRSNGSETHTNRYLETTVPWVNWLGCVSVHHSVDVFDEVPRTSKKAFR